MSAGDENVRICNRNLHISPKHLSNRPCFADTVRLISPPPNDAYPHSILFNDNFPLKSFAKFRPSIP